MTPLFGDILNWLAAGLLFPLMLLPLAGLVRGKLPSALLFVALLAAIAGAGIFFAHLAVDLDPPRFTAGFLSTAALTVAALFFASAAAGARAVVTRLAPVVEAFVRGAGRVSLFLVLAMAAIQFAAVILRYVFGLNFIAMQESVTYLHGAVFLLAGGYAVLTDDHVRVDIFYREASPRRKAMVDLAGTYLFLLPFCLVALWAASPYVANSWAVREGSVEQSGIKGVYLLKTLIPIYLTLLLLAGFTVAARAAETLRPSKG
jgi:TRAP-type mannitol/chloroaromatic compound transport system permease small subunit